MPQKFFFSAIAAAMLDFGNRYCFLNISVITQIEFMNIEMYILVQQIHIRLCLKLAKTRNVIVTRRSSLICMIFQLIIHFFPYQKILL